MQLWIHRGHPPDGPRWCPHPIPAGGLALGRDAAGGLSLGEGVDPTVAYTVAHLVPVVLRGSREIALVAAPGARGLRVGGLPPLAVVVLDDRAEIAFGDETLYLTKASPSAVERFEPAGEPVSCSRCTRVLRAGDAVLRCGACGAVHHEGERAEGGELACASYAAVCAACRRAGQAVDWTPEGLV